MDDVILEQSLTVVFGAGGVVQGQGGRGHDHHHDDSQQEVWTHCHSAGYWGLGSANKVAGFILIRNKRLSSVSKLMVHAECMQCPPGECMQGARCKGAKGSMVVA